MCLFSRGLSSKECWTCAVLGGTLFWKLRTRLDGSEGVDCLRRCWWVTEGNGVRVQNLLGWYGLACRLAWSWQQPRSPILESPRLEDQSWQISFSDGQLACH